MKPGRLHLQSALAVLLALISVLQLPWTWDAIHYDMHAQYDPSRQTAAYLHTLPQGLRIAAFGDGATILPYFRDNIFFNLPTTYNWYAPQANPYAELPAALASRPDLVVIAVAVWSGDNSMIRLAQASGYRETHRFCGAMFMPNVQSSEICQVVLEPSGGQLTP